jgi:hypothetical protein
MGVARPGGEQLGIPVDGHHVGVVAEDPRAVDEVGPAELDPDAGLFGSQLSIQIPWIAVGGRVARLV